MRFGLVLLAMTGVLLAEPPSINRIAPLGGQRGTTIQVELNGTGFSNIQSAQFDTREIVWRRTLSSSSKMVRGEVFIGEQVGLGPHLMKLLGPDGPSDSVLFYVGQFGAVPDREPNNSIGKAQFVKELPAEIYGSIDALDDTDYFAFDAKAGEDLRFEFRAFEYGSELEAKMHLFDAAGRRIAFNDDRSDYDDNPFLAMRSEQAGRYYLQVDLYRGPRANRAGANNSYVLRMSRLPELKHFSRLGGSAGSTARVTISGQGLDGASEAVLTQARRAEYFGMTYPSNIPISPEAAESPRRIRGEILRRQPDAVEVELRIPPDVPVGLWRWSLVSRHGIAEGGLFEIAKAEELGEVTDIDARHGELAVNGALASTRETDRYRLSVKAGSPLHIWTLSQQLGQPELDTVLELRSEDGKLLAENDDAVSGIASLGNPDSSLFHTPRQDGTMVLTIRDRQNRGGSAYAYRLRIGTRQPRFQLWTLPENLTVPRGGNAELKVQMAREPGFENEEVEVWVEGLPGNGKPPLAKFRADQAWEPGADLLQQITPELTIPITVPETVQAGRYAIRVLGIATRDRAGRVQQVVEAHANLKRGPLNGQFNFIRRPLPEVTLSVVDPVTATLTPATTTITAAPGAPALLQVQSKGVPPDAVIELRDLPPNVAWKPGRRDADRIEFLLTPAESAAGRTISFTAEAKVGGRWMTSSDIQLKVGQRVADASGAAR